MKPMLKTRFLVSRAVPFVLFFLLQSALAPRLSAQSSADEVKTYIRMLDQSRTDDARRALPDLITKYQNTPELLYLQGRLAADGIEAVKFYQSVVDNFPKSEYAPDALHRIYQYYYALGLYRTAEKKLAQLKANYPNSTVVAGTPSAKLPRQEELAVKLPEKDTAASDTPAAPGEIPVAPSTTPAAPTQKPAPAEKPAPVATRKPYTLQVGAFSTVANAEKQKGYFEELGMTAEITNKIRSGRSLHLVWVGSFGNAEEAKQASREIKSKYKIDSIVVERY
jgi:cell division septation protein DedD